MQMKGKRGLLQTPVPLKAHYAVRAFVRNARWEHTSPSDATAVVHFVPLSKRRMILTVKSNHNVAVIVFECSCN